jgi:hypothetical protein
VAAGRESKESLFRLLIGSALSFANAVNNSEKLSSYHGRSIAKTYNIGNEPGSDLLP